VVRNDDRGDSHGAVLVLQRGERGYHAGCFAREMMRRYEPSLKRTRIKVISVAATALLFLVSCMGKNPFLETALDPAKTRGETQSWFEKEWGTPSSKDSRWLGGEVWTYMRIAGGQKTLLGNLDPLTCKITLKFDDEGKLSSYKYSGC